MSTERIKLPLQRLDAQLSATSDAGEERRARLRWYTGQQVTQWDMGGPYDLTLSMAPQAVRLDLFKTGRAPILDTHSDYKAAGILGHVENGAIEGGVGVGDAVFLPPDPERPNLVLDVDRIWHAIKNKAITSVSVGAVIHKMRETTKDGATRRAFEATDWEPREISVCTSGADRQATIKASQSELRECEVEFCGNLPEGVVNMEQQQNNAAEDTRVSTITTLGAKFNLATLAAEHVAAGTTVEKFRAALIDRMAEQSGEPIRGHRTMGLRDERDPRIGAMSEALVCRYTGKAPSEAAREYMGCRISDMARVCLEAKGIRAPMNAARCIELAGYHSTSDFPHLTTEAGSRMLMDAYTASQSKLKPACRRSTFQDFKNKSILRLGEAPQLVKVPESGEVTSGSRGENKESYRGYSYARIFAITREALINDDLSSFSDFARAWGIAAASLEAQVIVDLLASNPTMHDTVALFDSAHGNLSGAPGAISDTTLGAARLALRTMTGGDGVTIIEVNPRYLVIPAALETTAEKYLTTIYPAQAADANPFSGKLELLVEPRLDAKSVTAWYVAGDPALCPVIEYAYLAGNEGPQVSSREGFEVLGQEFRAVLDFGCGAVDHRGWYKGNT